MQARVLNLRAFRVSMEAAPSPVRVEKIGGHMTELLELHSTRPRLQIVFVPGNPGIISFYQDYLADLSRFLGGAASITAVSHIAHTAKDWEGGKQFSLQQQIEHKVAFLNERVFNTDLPTVLVGHSIGAYIIMELLKQFPEKFQCVVGLYPFLKTNPNSFKQTVLKIASRNSVMRATLSSFAGLLGYTPDWFSRNLVKVVLGRTWGSCAVDTTCKYLLQASMVRNFTYMGMTEFQKLIEEPDWEFLREHQKKIYFLFGADDHWGPLTLLEQIHEQVPGLKTTVERENIMHDFCCSNFGSEWVARYTAECMKDS